MELALKNENRLIYITVIISETNTNGRNIFIEFEDIFLMQMY